MKKTFVLTLILVGCGGLLASRRRILGSLRSRFHPLWRLRQSSLYRRFQGRVDRTVFVGVPGSGFRVAVKLLRDASLWLSQSASEPEIQKCFSAVFESVQPRVFWDIGGNIGYYSWLTLSQCEGADVVIFEADQTNYDLISQTISRNNLASRARAIHAAVSDQDGTVQFLVDPVSGATGAIVAQEQTGFGSSLHAAYGLSQTLSVKSLALDTLAQQGYAAPDLMKIDVEGAERLVINGARALLRQSKPVIIMETTDNDLLQDLREMGYHIVPLDSSNVLCVPERWRDALVPQVESYAVGAA